MIKVGIKRTKNAPSLAVWKREYEHHPELRVQSKNSGKFLDQGRRCETFQFLPGLRLIERLICLGPVCAMPFQISRLVIWFENCHRHSTNCFPVCLKLAFITAVNE